MGFSEYKSTEEFLKSLEVYIFNKRYNHDTVDLVFEALSKTFQHRVFIFEESLTNSPRGIVGEKYNRCINVLKWGDHYNLIVVNEKGCEKLITGYMILILVQFSCFTFFSVLSSQQLYQKDVDLSSHFHDLHKSYDKDRVLGNLGIGIGIGIRIYSPWKAHSKVWDNFW